MAGKAQFVAGFVTGVLAGASIAIVLVPASPSEMRDRIRAKASES